MGPINDGVVQGMARRGRLAGLIVEQPSSISIAGNGSKRHGGGGVTGKFEKPVIRNRSAVAAIYILHFATTASTATLSSISPRNSPPAYLEGGLGFGRYAITAAAVGVDAILKSGLGELRHGRNGRN